MVEANREKSLLVLENGGKREEREIEIDLILAGEKSRFMARAVLLFDVGTRHSPTFMVARERSVLVCVCVSESIKRALLCSQEDSAVRFAERLRTRHARYLILVPDAPQQQRV